MKMLFVTATLNVLENKDLDLTSDVPSVLERISGLVENSMGGTSGARTSMTLLYFTHSKANKPP